MAPAIGVVGLLKKYLLVKIFVNHVRRQFGLTDMTPCNRTNILSCKGVIPYDI
jgi:hypothetical protein